MITKRINTQTEIDRYCKLYTSITGLDIPSTYLRHTKIFGFYQKGDLRGGYMINNISEHECRTLKCFVNENHRDRLSRKLSELNSAIEICCFWISRKAQNYRKASMMIWIDMAVRSTIQKCTHIVYGTNVKMLACVYAQPSESILLHSDHINGKKTWTFYGKKSCMLKSVFGILKSRWSR